MDMMSHRIVAEESTSALHLQVCIMKSQHLTARAHNIRHLLESAGSPSNENIVCCTADKSLSLSSFMLPWACRWMCIQQKSNPDFTASDETHHRVL